MPITFVSCVPESDTQAEPAFDFASLWRAYRTCRTGKHRSASAQRYALNVFDLLLATVAALNTRQWKPSTATAFNARTGLVGPLMPKLMPSDLGCCGYRWVVWWKATAIMPSASMPIGLTTVASLSGGGDWVRVWPGPVKSGLP